MQAPFVLLLSAALAGAGGDKAPEILKLDSVLVSLVEQVEVPAREAGVLVALGVREGQIVAEGAVLGQIDDAEAQFALTRARIELANAKKVAGNDIKVRFAKKSSEVAAAELKRATDAVEKLPKSVSDTEIDRLRLAAQKSVLEIEQSEHDFVIAQYTEEINDNQVKLAESNVARRKIVSPIPGEIVQVHRHKGEWLEPGKSVLRILRIDPLRVEGFVKADELKDDPAGCKATLIANVKNRGKLEFPGKVVFVSPEINPVNGQIRVWAEIENRDLLLRPGMKATLTIELGTSKAGESANQ